MFKLFEIIIEFKIFFIKELIQLMEDFDYDMDLLIEVLKKRNEENLQLKNNANNNNSNALAREIRSFKSIKLKNNIGLKPSK